MTGRLRIGIAAAVALLLTSSGLLRLLAPNTWIWPVVGVVIVSTASGELARRLVRPRPVVIVVQVLAVFWYDMVLLAHEVAFGGVLPTWTVFRRLADLYAEGARNIHDTAPGGAVTPGIAAILVMSLGALAILVDALAATYAVAPLAGLPLLALYLVPATRVGGGMDWLAFTVSAAGYTALLSAEGRDRLGRWGRPLVHAGTRRPAGGNGAAATGAGGQRARVDTGPIAATGHQITMFALIAAVLAPVLLPTVTSGLFGLGPSGGDGSGSGDGGTTSLSQRLDLKANLGSKVDEPILTYTPADGKGEYIRLQTLDVFRGDQQEGAWLQTTAAQNTKVPPDGLITTSVPGFTIAGLPPQPQKTTIQFTAKDVSTVVKQVPGEPALYSIPAPYPASQITNSAPDWTFNNDSLAISETQKIPSGFKYVVTSLDITKNLKEAQYIASGPINAAESASFAQDLDTSSVSPAVLNAVAAEAQRVTSGGTTPIEKARLLEAYFKDSKQFKYTLSGIPANPTGDAALEWMLTNKSGYCQYFASSMAIMARTLGIPARVAVGFTAGTDNRDGSYTVKSHDLHAWPELYFTGLGWLRFEPTVGIDGTSGGGHGSVPAYAEIPVSSKPSTAPSSSAHAGGPSASASKSNCTAQQRKAGICDDNSSSATTATKDKFGSLGWFGAVPRFFDYWLFGGSVGAIITRFVLLVLLLIACVPMAVRVVRRRRRGKVASSRRSRRLPVADEDALEWESADDAATDPNRVAILAAWAEVRDSATDLGYTWPSSETPRQSAERIIKQARFSVPAQDAMDRMTGLAERASYARTVRPAAASTDLFDDVKTIRSGLSEPVSRRTRIRATVLPPSAMTALRERREELTGRVYERVQSAGSKLRPRLRRDRGRR